MGITSKELRDTWIKFYESKGHKNIGAVSLIGDGTTGVMFNVAGMQPLMPYLLGKKHPDGTRLCNVQGCVRTVDIDEVGDDCHCTFFEMMGNWSLGDYFKKEKTAWTVELLTKKFGLDINKLCSSVFAGNESAPKDDETANLLIGLGLKPENIYYLGKKENGKENNWWELEGTTGTPCGPDNEWFYPLSDEKCCDTCDINCSCGRFVEVGNDVYMQYKKTENGYVPLENKNVDTGFGFERCLMFLNGLKDVYKTDLFWGAIKIIEAECGAKYGEDESKTRMMRIVADHTRTSVMLIGDENGITPSNVGAGYILRRIMRRAIRYTRQLGASTELLNKIAKCFINDVYKDAYPLLKEKEEYILGEITKESEKFDKMLVQGTKEFEKVISGIERKREFMQKSDPNAVVENIINGKTAFRLYDTFGFPLELTTEMATERGFKVDEDGFNEAFKEHQEKSRTVDKGTYKGGLEGAGEETTRLHTACHLLLAGLRAKFGTEVEQKGSNITSERLRFDFNFNRPLTAEEISWLEDFVNDKIKKGITVERVEMPFKDAIKNGAYGVHKAEPDEVVSIYKIGDVDFQICGGPHVKNTSEIGKFKITKEQSSSSGIRRIRAEIE